MSENAPQAIEASIVQAVLDEIARDRRAAHADLQEAREAFQDAIEELNASTQGVVDAKQAADDDAKSFARYEKRMPRQAYDARARALRKAQDAAGALFRVAQKEGEARVAPIRERIQALNARCTELANEWRAQERFARAAGIDLKAYWTPESGVPAREILGAPKLLEEAAEAAAAPAAQAAAEAALDVVAE